jgi:hypothetical protein
VKVLSICLILILILAACSAPKAGTSSPTLPIPISSASPTPDPVEQMRQEADIKVSDSGKTFPFGVTVRFSVFLDDARYPVSALRCSPEGVIGIVSNGSLRGPDLYPISFEGLQPGTCQLTDGDFSVRIVIQ